MDESKQELTQEIRELSHRRDELNGQVSDTLLSIDQAKEERAGLRNEIEDLQAKRDQDQETTDQYDARKAAYESDLDALNEEKKGLTTDVGALTRKRDGLKAEIEAFEASAPEREAVERARVSALIEADMSEKRAGLAQVVEERENEEKRSLEAIAAGNAYRADNEVLVGRNSGLEAELVSLRAQESALNTSIADKESREKALNNAISTKTADLADLEARNADLTAQNADLGTAAAGKTAELKTLDENLAAATAEYATKEKQLFAMGKRETALNQREAFIQAKYAEAGVAYTPIPN